MMSNKFSERNILVVGAGGIGCELLKNLVISDFKKISIIDLDTIDVSNLNRQFLFRREHVGKSKAEVAKESALKFNREVSITAIHGSIIQDTYDVPFFQTFDIILNALDNKAARNHVNRMCLAANVPLIESGSSGYVGQVEPIIRGVSQCYECTPKPTAKSYPACTIRNTPSEPIHCIIWAKYLFNQLFGEEDPDQDVAPDSADPELAAANNHNGESSSNAATSRLSTRQWAKNVNFDGSKLLHRLFSDDVEALLQMSVLWKREGRKQPIPLTQEIIEQSTQVTISSSSGTLRDQRQLSLAEWCHVFNNSVEALKERLTEDAGNNMLVWDKDDQASMEFVAAAANIRMYVFHMPIMTQFDIKAMAGNIIPAIATTNAIVAGLIVLEAYKVLDGQIEKCKSVAVARRPTSRKKFLVPCTPLPPNPKCYVCAAQPELQLSCDLEHFTLRALRDKVLKKELGMTAPDVEIEGRAVILISSDDDETEENMDKTLADFKVTSASYLRCDDFLQQYTLRLIPTHAKVADPGKQESPADSYLIGGDTGDVINAAKGGDGDNENGSKTDAEGVVTDSINLVDDENGPNISGSRKRKSVITSSDEVNEAKKKRLDDASNVEEDDDDLIMIS